jgi:signal transduction histidine kinase
MACHLNSPAQPSAPETQLNLITISSVTVRDKAVPMDSHGKASLGTSPENIVIHFEPTTNWNKAPTRLHYRLDGYDTSWREGNCEMYLTARFFDEAGDMVNQSEFKIHGESPGWSGSIKTSALTHRRESLTVPPQASRLMILISSAGPPATEGVYVVANLTVTRKSPGQSEPVTLIENPFSQQPDNDDLAQAPSGWVRDGTHASMAKIVKIGHDPAVRACAIYDDDPISHAEWRNTFEMAPKVSPGDILTIEWNEMYSMGVGDTRLATYNNLKPGKYMFNLEEVNIFGAPTDVRTSLEMIVPQPFWQTTWFWGFASFGFGLAIFGTGRYLTWHKVQREMMRLKGQQALEQERLRIAQDIHDDLGARVTEISLASALAKKNPALPDTAGVDFDRISQMSRDLVAALYETVWAVNPENDNLDSLGTYLCQIANHLCKQAQLPCRLELDELPNNIRVSSQIRHNIAMAVKEAVHNAVKHSDASEITLHMTFQKPELTICVNDNGTGFNADDAAAAGNGLKNIKRRLAAIGARCQVESRIGSGASIQMRIKL